MLHPLVKNLESREDKSLDSTRYSYKLQEGHFAIDTSSWDGFEVDGARMAITWPYCDGNRRDNTGDLLEIDGISLERHRKNPFVLYDHGKEISLPIAMAQDPKSMEYWIRLDPVAKRGFVKGFFYDGRGTNVYKLGGLNDETVQAMVAKTGGISQHARFCEQHFDMMAKGFVRGGSLGYLILDGYELPGDQRTTGAPEGVHLVKTLQLEASSVVMPAHMDTVRKCLESSFRCCGKPLTDYHIKSFRAAAPKRKSQLGWASHAQKKCACGCGGTCGCGKKDKNMGQSPVSPLTQTHVPNAAQRQDPAATSVETPTNEDGSIKALRAKWKKYDIEDAYEKYIKHEGGKWVVHAESGKVLGRHDSEEEAKAQLAAVEAHKHGKGIGQKGEGLAENGRERASLETSCERRGVPKGKTDMSNSGGISGAGKGKSQSPPSRPKPYGGTSAGEAKPQTTHKPTQDTPGSHGKAQPSDNFTEDKAKKILKEGHINKNPISEKQHGMLEAAAHRGEKSMEPSEVAAGGVDGGSHGDEPVSSQVMRRWHEDNSILMEDYDRLNHYLEHAPTKKPFERKIAGLGKELDWLEQHHKTHHPDLPELGKDEEDAGDAVGADSEPKLQEEKETEGSDVENLDNMNVKGLRRYYLKGIREHYKAKALLDARIKALPPRRDVSGVPGNEEFQPKPGMQGEDPAMGTDLGEEEHQPPGGAMEDGAEPGAMTDVGEEENQPVPGAEAETLAPHHKSVLSRAYKFMKELESADEFTREQQMGAYHHAKNMEEVAGEIGNESAEMGGMTPPIEEEHIGVAGTKVMPTGRSAEMGMGNEVPPEEERHIGNARMGKGFPEAGRADSEVHVNEGNELHRRITGAANLLHEIAHADDLTEVHRGKLKQHCDLMAPLSEQIGEAHIGKGKSLDAMVKSQVAQVKKLQSVMSSLLSRVG